MKRLIRLLCMTALLMTCVLSAACDEEAQPRARMLALRTTDEMILLDEQQTSEDALRIYSMPESGALVLFGTFADEKAAQAKLADTLSDTGTSDMMTGLEAVDGRYAEWTRRVTPSGAYMDVVTVYDTRTLLFCALTPGEMSEESRAALIDALYILDPAVPFMLSYQPQSTAAPALTLDEEADIIWLQATRDMANVRLAAVSYDESLFYKPGDVLYSLDRLAAGDSVGVRMYLPDVQPGLSVLFSDETGADVVRYITDSGIDGALMIVE